MINIIVADSPALFEQVYNIRYQVFHLECRYLLEWIKDEEDLDFTPYKNYFKNTNLLLFYDQIPVATAALRNNRIKSVAVLKEYRSKVLNFKQGLAYTIVKKIIEIAKELELEYIEGTALIESLGFY